MTPRGQPQTALVSIGAAVLLVVLKLGTGIATGSLALVSAGVESSGAGVGAGLTLAARRLPRHPPRGRAHSRARPAGDPRGARRGADPLRRWRLRRDRGDRPPQLGWRQRLR